MITFESVYVIFFLVISIDTMLWSFCTTITFKSTKSLFSWFLLIWYLKRNFVSKSKFLHNDPISINQFFAYLISYDMIFNFQIGRFCTMITFESTTKVPLFCISDFFVYFEGFEVFIFLFNEQVIAIQITKQAMIAWHCKEM